MIDRRRYEYQGASLCFCSSFFKKNCKLVSLFTMCPFALTWTSQLGQQEKVWKEFVVIVATLLTHTSIVRPTYAHDLGHEVRLLRNLSTACKHLYKHTVQTHPSTSGTSSNSAWTEAILASGVPGTTMVPPSSGSTSAPSFWLPRGNPTARHNTTATTIRERQHQCCRRRRTPGKLLLSNFIVQSSEVGYYLVIIMLYNLTY